jgi:hypothetical protein
MITFIIILTLLVGVLGYTSYNLFRKVEKLEKMVDGQDRYIQQFSSAVDFTNKRLGEIDDKGTFQSDDEIGWFFESIKTLQNELNDFNLNGNRK